MPVNVVLNEDHVVTSATIANPVWLKTLAYIVAFVIAALNAWLLVQTFQGWMS